MDREEFETYLNANSRAVALFRSRALSYQHSQNRKRAASKRWSETVVASAVDKMVSQFVDNVYDKLLNFQAKCNDDNEFLIVV